MKIALSPLVFCLLFHAAGAAWLCQGSAVCGLTGFLTAPNNSPPCAISTILVTLQQLEEAAAQRRPVLLCVWAMASKTSSVGLFLTKKIKLFSGKPSCPWWFHLCRSEAETSGPAWSLWCPREGFSGTLRVPGAGEARQMVLENSHTPMGSFSKGRTQTAHSSQHECKTHFFP